MATRAAQNKKAGETRHGVQAPGATVAGAAEEKIKTGAAGALKRRLAKAVCEKVCT